MSSFLAALQQQQEALKKRNQNTAGLQTTATVGEGESDSNKRPRHTAATTVTVSDDNVQHRSIPHSTPPSSYWLDVLTRMITKRAAQEEAERRSKMIRSRYEVMEDAGWATQECQGDKRVREIQKLLQSGFGLKRSEHQIMFQQFFLQACLPKIYGEEWPDHCLRVLEEFDLKQIDPEVMIITARRWGKSISVAMFVLSLLLSVPGIQIAIFSTGSRASTSLYDIMMGMLCHMPDAYSRVVKNTKEHLFIASQSLPKGVNMHSTAARKMWAMKDTSRLYAFPGGEKGKKTQNFNNSTDFRGVPPPAA